MTASFQLRTDRLLLRQFEETDAPGFFQMNADPEVLQYTGDQPFRDVAAARSFIAGYDAYQRYGYGRWTVRRLADDTYLGFCGLRYDPKLDEVDLGFRIIRTYWGKGYATEAAQACLQYAFDALAIPMIVGRARRENLASIRVLEKLGFVYWKDFAFDNQYPGVYYRLNRT